MKKKHEEPVEEAAVPEEAVAEPTKAEDKCTVEGCDAPKAPGQSYLCDTHMRRT